MSVVDANGDTPLHVSARVLFVWHYGGGAFLEYGYDENISILPQEHSVQHCDILCRH